MVELTKCTSQNSKCNLCWQCKRNAPVQKDEEEEEFPVRKSMMNGWECSGYISKRQEKGLFDE